MSKKMYLNYQFQPAIQQPNAQTMLFLHGLFGDMNNLGIIARKFAEKFNILRVDLRNHGRSFHSEQMNYSLMAQDLIDLLTYLNITEVIVVGHSMGGKTAMTLAHMAPELIDKLVVIDIAPVSNPLNRHDNIFEGLFAVKASQALTRQQAQQAMQNLINEQEQPFLLKSFDAQSSERFRFNLSALKAQYPYLMDWQEVFFDKPTLFIKGADSDYIQAKDTATILAQFPQAISFIVANANHWVHVEKPDAVVRAITKFLNKDQRL
ncbi:acyl-CoA esterase [[Haemophilus] ducreyi]|uniref:alpha/beta fold hydrolase n=1 Tax=Haemophilus ducreyi TaxID=730 RepID=UPI0007CDA027|nr:alpha/beta fold hydrolase [[Haemophilus] ducreyi]ANF70676.1 acyl-CoA esterase [[Haemophilus] ducreyi]ANF72141.1 acyl-CoA esterase [[Haemophilus] ducreyi]